MDDDQQFCLRWNNHQSTLISVFDTLLENGTLVDCTLAAEGKFLKAHKVVLSACSPYFAALLSQQYDKHPIFILKDVKFKELRAMMDYMYRGEVNISQDQLAALLKAAESLQIKGLSDSRGGNSNAMPTQNKSDGKSHVPAPKASGLTIENKRPLNRPGMDFDAQDVSRSREGSVSPSTRKRKKINQRRKSLTESNSMLDNHDQHSNSSSHSLANNQQLSNNTSATSATSNLLSVTKKTESQQQDVKSNLEQQQQQAIQQKQSHVAGENGSEDDGEVNEQEQIQMAKRTKHDDTDNKHQESELMIEPKPEYDDDGQDENVEDLTLDDEELMDDMDQPGPSHGGEGSSQGYHWQLDGRNQDEGMLGQDSAGQHRDAQGMKMKSTTVSTPLELNDCLLESENIQITKKDDKYLLQPVKMQSKQASVKFVLQECEIIPVNKQRAGVLKKETVPIVSKVQPIVQTSQVQIVHNQTPVEQLKKVKPNHPRIKYSRHKNPTFISQQHHEPQSAQHVIASRPSHTQPVPHLNNESLKKIEYISLASKAEGIVTPQSKPTTIIIPHTNAQFIIQPTSTPLVSTTSSNTSQYEVTEQQLSHKEDFSNEMMDELDYSGIDDIELPDDVHIQLSDNSFKDEKVSGNGMTSGNQSAEEGHSQTKKYSFSVSDNSMASDGEESGRQFECKHCGKRYRWKSTLRRHENVECGGKEASHQCLYCNYRAKQRGNLGVHIRKHHADKPPLQTRRKSSKHMLQDGNQTV